MPDHQDIHTDFLVLLRFDSLSILIFSTSFGGLHRRDGSNTNSGGPTEREKENNKRGVERGKPMSEMQERVMFDDKIRNSNRLFDSRFSVV